MENNTKHLESGQLFRLLQAGHLSDARKLATHLIKSSPTDITLLRSLGTILGRLGEFQQAESCYRTLAALQTKSHEHHFYLGISLIMQGKLQEAVDPFREMLHLKPEFAEGHMQMGCLLRDLGHYRPAIKHLKHALDLNPELADAAVFLANLLVFQGQIDTALAWLDHALSRRPDHQDAIAAKALALEKLGDSAGAMACLQPSLDTTSPSPGIAIAYATLAPSQQQIASAQNLLQRLLNRQDLIPSQRQELLFSLARLLDKVGSYDSAFQQYSAANRLSRLPNNVNVLRAEAEQLMRGFEELTLPDIHLAENGAPTPIFIVGMPRSGTSLLETILACHPDVEAGGELDLLPQIVRDIPKMLNSTETYPACLYGVTNTELDLIASRYQERMTELAQGSLYVTDKLPTNYKHLGLILKLFPQARIIHMQRDPRDTCLSCFFQNFGDTHIYSSDLLSISEVYKLYKHYISFWQRRFPDSWLNLRYETLVTHTRESIRDVLRYCELPWNENCLNFHTLGRYINTASYNQIKQPMYRNSIGRWKNYKPHIKQLCDSLKTN